MPTRERLCTEPVESKIVKRDVFDELAVMINSNDL